ncbi:MAG: hypothetical protein IPL84_08825 [Chitinophagaceae bacterium]|nr:hypothetical protein [Chitinophagaceae bacterium]
MADTILKNKFTLNVFGSVFDSYHINASLTKEHTEVYVIQFITKSMLFNEIEESLKNEFPQTDFSICATPLVHIAFNLHDKISKRVNGTNLVKEETED